MSKPAEITEYDLIIPSEADAATLGYGPDSIGQMQLQFRGQFIAKVDSIAAARQMIQDDITESGQPTVFVEEVEDPHADRWTFRLA